MQRDAFGQPITFGIRAIVGRRRKDGMYPVRYVMKSTGSVLSKLRTAEQLDAQCRNSQYEVVGYTPTKGDSDAAS